MTPEERAKAIAFGDERLQYNVLVAIRAAVEEERESCARAAESFIPSGFTSDGKAGNTYAVARDDRARTIAAAIRARAKEAQS